MQSQPVFSTRRPATTPQFPHIFQQQQRKYTKNVLAVQLAPNFQKGFAVQYCINSNTRCVKTSIAVAASMMLQQYHIELISYTLYTIPAKTCLETTGTSIDHKHATVPKSCQPHVSHRVPETETYRLTRSTDEHLQRWLPDVFTWLPLFPPGSAAQGEFGPLPIYRSFIPSPCWRLW